MITVENLKITIPQKGAADRVILDSLSLSVADGEFLTIVGPSGCGKTTLLRSLAGLQPAVAGSIKIDGNVVTRPSDRTAIVFQDFALMPWRTAGRNVEFPLERSSISRVERRSRAIDALERVRLDGAVDLRPAQMSGGMKQRVGLARALATDADILLMDEPFGAVDPQVRRVLQGVLLDIWAETGKTIVFVTHDIDEAVLLSDRICVLGVAPSGIREVVELDVPRPRLTAELEIIADSRISEYRAALWRTLSHDIQASERDQVPVTRANMTIS